MLFCSRHFGYCNTCLARWSSFELPKPATIKMSVSSKYHLLAMRGKLFENLLDDQDFTDVVVASGEHLERKCHKLVLSQRSHMFAAMLSPRNAGFSEGNQSRIELVGLCRPTSFQKFISYIYGRIDACIPECLEEAVELIEAVQLYGIEGGLMEKCCQNFIVKNMKVEDIPKMLRWSELFKLKAVKGRALAMFYKNKTEVMSDHLEVFMEEIAKDPVLLSQVILNEGAAKNEKKSFEGLAT